MNNKLNRLQYQKILVLLICITLSYVSIQAQINHTVTFDISKLTTTTEIVDGNTYTHLYYPDLLSSLEVGAPELPLQSVMFSVPYNATDFSIVVINQTSTTQILSHQLCPVQPPVPASTVLSKPSFVAPDQIKYNASQYLPISAVSILDEGFLDGDNRIVTVAVYPLNYNPSTRELRFNTSMTIQLNYSIEAERNSGLVGNENNSKIRSISRPLPLQREFGKQIARKLVINPDHVDVFAPKVSMQNPRTVVNIPVFEYCVITNRELAPAFERLIGWKRQKGIFAGVVCIEDILASPDFADGDLVSNINDDAGKLRAYLRYAYYGDGAIKYVLMGGDSSILPIRYGTGEFYRGLKCSQIPTDLYFSDFNGNWNANDDKYFGDKYSDKIDFLQEIYIGRLLCTSAEEVQNYTEKLIKYELNPGNGDYSYLSRALYSQSKEMQDYHQADVIASDLISIYPTYKIFQEDKNNIQYPSGSDIINEINKTQYGFVSIHGHGSPDGVAVNYLVRPVKGVLAQEGEALYLNKDPGSGLDNLNNYNYPMISYSMSCTLMPYDIYTDDMDSSKELVYNVKCNFGRAFTSKGLYGGPAFLGNTRYGYIDSSFKLEQIFIKEIEKGFYSLGAAEANSKPQSNLHWIKLAHNLLGCPEFEMWTDTPTKCPSVAVRRTDNSITVTAHWLRDYKVAITSGIHSIPQVELATGSSVTFNNVSPNSVITIYKHNGIPYIAPLYLQNQIQNESQYIHAGKVFIGKKVDVNRTQGNYIVQNGKTLTLEASGDVLIDAGFVVESGATVIVKCKGNVIITGGEILSGGFFCVEARNVDVQRGFNVEFGAKFETKNNN